MTTFKTTSITAALLFLSACGINFAAAVDVVDFEPTPTCASMGDGWYFPNACVTSCQESGSTMDLDRSRNVGSKMKCFCVDQPKPFCTDDPLCADLGIFPGTVAEDCNRACGEGDSGPNAKITVDDNGYQFHYVVGCICGDGTRLCGEDYVLFRDLDYMKSCSDKTSNSLNIKSAEDCDAFCDATDVFTEAGIFARNATNTKLLSCSCKHSSIISDNPDIAAALACDDATASVNDGSGLGNPCYENVGVNTVECPDPADASSAASSKEQGSTSTTTKTLVSSTAIMGVWLLPW